MRAAVPVAAALVLLCAKAEAAPRVVVVSPPEHAHTAARLRDELVVMGVEVEVTSALPSPGGAAPPDAVVIVSGPPMRLALRFSAPADATTAEETVINALSEGSSGEASLVLRAAEMMRARIIPAPLPPPPSPPPPPSRPRPPAAEAPSEPAPIPRRARPLFMSLSPGVLLSPGGAPPMALLRIGIGYRLGWRLSVVLDAFSPTAPGAVGNDGGSIDLWYFHLSASAQIAFTELTSPFAVFGGMGLGTTSLFYSGDAAPPNVAEEGSVWTIAPTASLGAAYYPLEELGVRADVHVSVARPEPVFRVAGDEVARFGQPAVVISLGLEVRP